VAVCSFAKQELLDASGNVVQTLRWVKLYLSRKGANSEISLA
jgi:hypothetical protein